jgi:hypothetical protein
MASVAAELPRDYSARNLKVINNTLDGQVNICDGELAGTAVVNECQRAVAETVLSTDDGTSSSGVQCNAEKERGMRTAPESNSVKKHRERAPGGQDRRISHSSAGGLEGRRIDIFRVAV